MRACCIHTYLSMQLHALFMLSQTVVEIYHCEKVYYIAYHWDEVLTQGHQVTEMALIGGSYSGENEGGCQLMTEGWICQSYIR